MFSSITKSTPNLKVLGRWGEVLSNFVLRCRWRRPMDSVTRLPPWGWEWLGWSAVGRICQVVFGCILFTKFNPWYFAGWRPFWWRCSTARLEEIVCRSALLIIVSWASSRKKGRCCRYLNIFRMFQIKTPLTLISKISKLMQLFAIFPFVTWQMSPEQPPLFQRTALRKRWNRETNRDKSQEFIVHEIIHTQKNNSQNCVDYFALFPETKSSTQEWSASIEDHTFRLPGSVPELTCLSGWFQMCRAISMLHFLKWMTFLLLKIRSQFCMSFYALAAALTL